MKIYQVGGSVRDMLLGRPSEDLDYVVVGATAQEMLDAGFKQVGADFPVFLHPQTNDEYALARTERKTAAGYLGFSVDTAGVTLEEDLSRRDLTINAMALDASGAVVDPYGGQTDLANKVLRHVSHAFEEDPVRVLRIARFLARFGDSWQVSGVTRFLCETMVVRGDLDSLVAERVWKEMSRLLQEEYPAVGLTFLNSIGLFKTQGAYLFKSCTESSIEKLSKVPAEMSLWAKLLISIEGTSRDQLVEHCAFPSVMYKTKQSFDNLVLASAAQAADRLAYLEKAGVFRKAEEFEEALILLEYLDPAQGSMLRQDTENAKTVSSKNFDFKGMSGEVIKKTLFDARLAAMTAPVKTTK